METELGGCWGKRGLRGRGRGFLPVLPFVHIESAGSQVVHLEQFDGCEHSRLGHLPSQIKTGKALRKVDSV